jgi:hypothetical protein
VLILANAAIATLGAVTHEAATAVVVDLALLSDVLRATREAQTTEQAREHDKPGRRKASEAYEIHKAVESGAEHSAAASGIHKDRPALFRRRSLSRSGDIAGGIGSGARTIKVTRAED